MDIRCLARTPVPRGGRCPPPCCTSVRPINTHYCVRIRCTPGVPLWPRSCKSSRPRGNPSRAHKPSTPDVPRGPHCCRSSHPRGSLSRGRTSGSLCARNTQPLHRCHWTVPSVRCRPGPPWQTRTSCRHTGQNCRFPSLVQRFRTVTCNIRASPSLAPPYCRTFLAGVRYWRGTPSWPDWTRRTVCQRYPWSRLFGTNNSQPEDSFCKQIIHKTYYYRHKININIKKKKIIWLNIQVDSFWANYYGLETF